MPEIEDLSTFMSAKSEQQSGYLLMSFSPQVDVNFVCVFVLKRAKLFKGKKVHGDYDIKVEQVRLTKLFLSILGSLC